MTISRRSALTLVGAAPLAAALPAALPAEGTLVKSNELWIRVANPLDDKSWDDAMSEGLSTCLKQMEGRDDGAIVVRFERYLKVTRRLVPA